MVNEKAEITNTKFHACSMPRRCWTRPEWRKAVAISHGIKEAFSTGSQAQYPPQERTSYAHQPPSVIPTVRNDQATRVERWLRRSHSGPGMANARAPMAYAKGTESPTYPR